MKVLQILYSGLGGHGSVALSLAAAADESGDWVNSLVFLGIEPLLPEYAKQCRLRGIAFEYVATRQGQPWWSWWNLYHVLDAHQPDAIVLHSVKAIIPCYLYARRRGIPLVAVEHQPNELKQPAEWWVSCLLMRFADAVVVLTTDYRDELARRLGVAFRAAKIHLIPNGIDTRAFAPQRAKPRSIDRPICVGMAARFSNRKRQELLIGAIEILQERDGPGSWQLSLAGEGETRAALQESVSGRHPKQPVSFPGYLAEQELQVWFAGLDIYAHASDGETLSTSLLQAMAMGLPIVGSDVPGIANLLSAEEKVGLVASEQSAQGFADALSEAVASWKSASHLGCLARVKVEREFSQIAMFASYQKVIDACVVARSA